MLVQAPFHISWVVKMKPLTGADLGPGIGGRRVGSQGHCANFVQGGRKDFGGEGRRQLNGGGSMSRDSVSRDTGWGKPQCQRNTPWQSVRKQHLSR